jgi:hypothetical protein
MIYHASLFELKTGRASHPTVATTMIILPTTPSPNSSAETPNASLTETRR